MMADFVFLMVLAVWWCVRRSLFLPPMVSTKGSCNSFLGFLYALWILGHGQYSIYDISKWMIWIW
jgi:hypothetical protein